MPIRFYDRVKELSTSTGTGNFTLTGAASQSRSFTSVFTAGASLQAADSFYYAIVAQTGGEWEVGIGYMTSATNLVRSEVLASSNSNNAVNFSASTKDVFCTIAGALMDDLAPKGRYIATATGQNWF